MTPSPSDSEMQKQTFNRMHAQNLNSPTQADKRFLQAFEAGEPDWNLFPEPAIRHLPAVQWKLLNIQTFKQASPVSHAEGPNKLSRVLDQTRPGKAGQRKHPRRGNSQIAATSFPERTRDRIHERLDEIAEDAPAFGSQHHLGLHAGKELEA